MKRIDKMRLDNYVLMQRAENRALAAMPWTMDEIKVYNDRMVGIDRRLAALLARRMTRK